MKTKTGKRKLWVRIMSLVCMFCVCASVLWCDYKTAYAYNPLPWTSITPNFSDFVMIMIAQIAGIPCEIDRNTVRKLKGLDDYDQRYQECLRVFHEKYGDVADSPIKTGFGWTNEEYSTFAEQTAHYYATTCQEMPEEMVPIYETEVYKKIWGGIKDALTNSQTLQKVFPNGKPAGLSFSNFCYQAQVCFYTGVAQNIVTAAGASASKLCYVSTGVTSQGVANVLDNSLFKLLNTLYRVNVYEYYNTALMTYADDSVKGAVCDYTLDFWTKNNPILTISGTNFTSRYDLLFGPVFFNPIKDVSSKFKMFPLTFEIDGIPQIGVASTEEFANLNQGLQWKWSIPGSMSKNYSFLIRGGYGPIISPNLNSHKNANDSRPADIQPYYDAYKTRVLLQTSPAVQVWDEHVIDVENLDNFLSFTSHVLGGNYTLEELLELIHNGWVANPEKDKAAVVEGGHIAKDVIDKSKEKYKDEDKVVTPGSLSNSMPKNPAKDDVWGTDVTSEDVTSWEEAIERAGENAREGEEESRKAIANGELAGFDTQTGELDREKLGEDINKLPNEEGKKPYVPGLDIPGSSGSDGKTQWYQRFPFCIPWDIYHFISVFNGQKKAPKWDIPFKVKRLGINEKITFDISEYEEVVKVIRVFVLLFYSSGLVLITRNIIKG